MIETATERNTWSLEPSHFDGLVYTMGRVSSRTINRSLKREGLYYPTLHRTSFDYVLGEYKVKFLEPQATSTAQSLRGLLAQEARKRGDRINIVTAVRDPVSRNLSAIFHHLKPGHGSEADVLAAIKGYQPMIPDRWFTNDFGPYTGIDWLSLEVDRGSDHVLLSNDNMHVLVLKVESTTARKEVLISDFVGRPVTLANENVGGEKWYSDLYKKTKGSITEIAPDFVRESIAQKYFKTFYSEDEIARVCERYHVPIPGGR